MVTVLRQPLAKMLRHLTRKTLFLTKHRIESHISKLKQLPSPSPTFNVVLRKFQHDLLLWPTFRRERGGLKREDLIGTLDFKIGYNVSSLFATGCNSSRSFKGTTTSSMKSMSNCYFRLTLRHAQLFQATLRLRTTLISIFSFELSSLTKTFLPWF